MRGVVGNLPNLSIAVFFSAIAVARTCRVANMAETVITTKIPCGQRKSALAVSSRLQEQTDASATQRISSKEVTIRNKQITCVFIERSPFLVRLEPFSIRHDSKADATLRVMPARASQESVGSLSPLRPLLVMLVTEAAKTDVFVFTSLSANAVVTVAVEHRFASVHRNVRGDVGRGPFYGVLTSHQSHEH